VSIEQVRSWVKNARNSYPPQILERLERGLGPTIVMEEMFGNFYIRFDGYWTYFRHESDHHAELCKFEEAMGLDVLPDCARYCWKVLLFSNNSKDVEKSIEILLPLLKKGEITVFKHNGDRLFFVGREFVIVMYTWGTQERDNLKAKLHSLGFKNVPYRLGCKAFETRFGHWKTWFKGNTQTLI